MMTRAAPQRALEVDAVAPDLASVRRMIAEDAQRWQRAAEAGLLRRA